MCVCGAVCVCVWLCPLVVVLRRARLGSGVMRSGNKQRAFFIHSMATRGRPLFVAKVEGEPSSFAGSCTRTGPCTGR